jgi:hypothetical protein
LDWKTGLLLLLLQALQTRLVAVSLLASCQAPHLLLKMHCQPLALPVLLLLLHEHQAAQ